MNLWLLLALALLVQEPVSTAGLLSEAYTQHYPLWPIHGLFVVATLIDIVVGYYLGAFIHKRFAHTKVVSWLRTKFDALVGMIGKKGKIATLIFFVPIIFPISALFLSWLEVSLGEALIYVLIGEAVFWYAQEWLIVLGVHAFTKNTHIALYIILLITLVLSIYGKRAYNKATRKDT
ncbi:MAG: hypothetical protein JWN50_202 [Parcubacteria group bacterium]|nr:hypothetical protein [Parcubacteria group bacterium]